MFSKNLTNNSLQLGNAGEIDISRLDWSIIRKTWKNVMVKNQRNLLNYREQILLYILAPNLLQLQFYSLIT